MEMFLTSLAIILIIFLSGTSLILLREWWKYEKTQDLFCCVTTGMLAAALFHILIAYHIYQVILF